MLLSFALPWALEAQSYSFVRYGLSEGLANPSVHSLGEDAAGVLWAGTEAGVFRSVGGRWLRVERYGAGALGNVVGMQSDAAGRFWVVSEQQISYDQGAARHLPVPGERGRSYQHLYVPGGGGAREYAVYVMRGDALHRVRTANGGQSWVEEPALDAATLGRYPQLKTVTAIAGEPESGGAVRLWAGCGTGLCRLTFPTPASVPEVEVWGAAQGVPMAEWTALLWGTGSGGERLLWARSASRLLAFSPPGQAAPAHAEVLGRGVLDGSVQTTGYASLVEDRDGRVLTNVGDGLARWDGKRWETIGPDQGLERAQVSGLYLDKQGALWMGTLGHGLARWLGYGQWQGWTRQEGLSSDVIWDLARDTRGVLWAATGTDVDRLDAARRRWVPFHPGTPVPGVQALVPDARGHLWGGTSTGKLLDLDPRTGRVRLVADKRGTTYQLLVDHGGRVWMASEGGLGFVDAGDGWAKLQAAPGGEHGLHGGLPSPVTSLTESHEGALWAVAAGALYREDGDGWVLAALPASMRLQNACAAADGTLWASGSLPDGQALVQLRIAKGGSGLTANPIGSLNQEQIGSPIPTTIKQDRRGWLWVGSEAGLRVFDGRRWVAVTSGDGLIWDDVDQGSFLDDGDGTLWFGTTGGLSHLLRPHAIFGEQAPRLLVEQAQLDGVTLVRGKRVTARHPTPTLQVKLAATDADRLGAVEFRYELEGLEPGWHEISSDGLRLPLQDAGNYTLHLLAVDTRRSLRSPEVVYQFSVLPRWWNRWWFRLCEAVALLAFLVGAWRLSVRVMVARQAELERQVAARTEELEREKADLLEARAKLVELSRYDTLTGILNRAAIFETLNVERRRRQADGEQLAVVMADLDRFKAINDTHGHVVGDAVLRECARRLQGTLRPGDSVGRYGGEELLLLIPGLKPDSAATRMEELRKAIARTPVVHEDTLVWVTCSFGLAWLQGEEMEIAEAIALADEALYRAKQNGRNRVEFASTLVKG